MNNQLMDIRLGKYGIIHAWHKDSMIKLEDILEVANSVRESKGLKPKELKTYLRRPDTWEYVIKVWNSEIIESKSFVAIAPELLYETLLMLPKDKLNRIRYSEVFNTKTFDLIFRKTSRGKFVNRGTWANVYIAIDFAMWLDVDVKHEVIKAFVEGKILQYRDDGGEAFKAVNKLVTDKLYGGEVQDRFIYVGIARLVNERVNGKFSKGWNGDDKDASKQEYRANILDKLCFAIDSGLVKSLKELNSVIENI